jgi:hypothetical protein
MIPHEAGSWSKERISQEIRNRRDYIRQLEEAIEAHEETYRRFPNDGFQGRGLETEKREMESEIYQLTELL